MFTSIPLFDFVARIDVALPGSHQMPTQVVSLQQLVVVESLQPMPRGYLRKLLARVPLAGDAQARPYPITSIETARIDPHSVLMGQTFVERVKYQQFLEGFDALFSGFCVPRGMAKLGAHIVWGKTVDGEYAVAHYIPPIVERTMQGLALLDGVHRMFLGRQVGTTREAIVVDPAEQFPCGLHGWDVVKVVETKPPLEKRYTDLRPHLFRDLKYVGIDG